MTPDEQMEQRANYYKIIAGEDAILREAGYIAWEEFGREFYELGQQDAERIWAKAEIAYANYLADIAEQERENCE